MFTPIKCFRFFFCWPYATLPSIYDSHRVFPPSCSMLAWVPKITCHECSDLGKEPATSFSTVRIFGALGDTFNVCDTFQSSSMPAHFPQCYIRSRITFTTLVMDFHNLLVPISYLLLVSGPRVVSLNVSHDSLSPQPASLWVIGVLDTRGGLLNTQGLFHPQHSHVGTYVHVPWFT